MCAEEDLLCFVAAKDEGSLCHTGKCHPLTIEINMQTNTDSLRMVFFCHLAVLRPCRDKGLFFYLTRHNNEHTTKELSGIFGYFIRFNFRSWCDSGKGKTRAERKSIMFHLETCNQTNFCQIRRKQAHKVLAQKWMKRKTLCLCVFSLYFPVHRLSSLLQQLINLKLFSACFFFPLSLLSYFCYRRHSEIFAVTIILLNLFCCPFSCWK